MTTEQRDGANSRVLSTDELDIDGRVMWFFKPPGVATAMNWKRLTIDRERMMIDWGGGIETIELAGVEEITVWPPRERSNGDKSVRSSEAGNT